MSIAFASHDFYAYSNCLTFYITSSLQVFTKGDVCRARASHLSEELENNLQYNSTNMEVISKMSANFTQIEHCVLMNLHLV